MSKTAHCGRERSKIGVTTPARAEGSLVACAWGERRIASHPELWFYRLRMTLPTRPTRIHGGPPARRCFSAWLRGCAGLLATFDIAAAGCQERHYSKEQYGRCCCSSGCT